jgi:uncharacterized protein
MRGGGSVKFSVHEIRDVGVLELDDVIPADHFTGVWPDRAEMVGPARVHLRAEADENGVWAAVSAHATFRLPCARCLDAYETALTTSFDMTVDAAQTHLEVDDEVRQNLILALPVKPLCRPGCQGLCAHCGKNLNPGPCGCPPDEPDSPFAALRKLKET